MNNHGGSPGKRLGLKKFSGIVLWLSFANSPVTEQPFSDQFVKPGNIIVRQRGTLFHPGQHVGLLFILSSDFM